MSALSEIFKYIGFRTTAGALVDGAATLDKDALSRLDYGVQVAAVVAAANAPVLPGAAISAGLLVLDVKIAKLSVDAQTNQPFSKIANDISGIFGGLVLTVSGLASFSGNKPFSIALSGAAIGLDVTSIALNHPEKAAEIAQSVINFAYQSGSAALQATGSLMTNTINILNEYINNGTDPTGTLENSMRQLVPVIASGSGISTVTAVANDTPDYPEIKWTDNSGNSHAFISGKNGNFTADYTDIVFYSGASGNAHGQGMAIHLQPNSYAGVFGTATVDGIRDSATINLGGVGTRAIVYGVGGVGGYVGMVDHNQSLILGNWGFSVATAPNVQGLAINGDHANITFAANTSGNVSGQEIALHLQPNSNSYAGFFGSGTIDGINGSTSINLGGAWTRATVYGAGGIGGYVGMVDNNQSLTLGNWGFSVATAPNLQGLDVTGDHANITFAANTSGNVHGQELALHLQPNSNSYAGFFGSGTIDGINGSTNINLGGAWTRATVYGAGGVGGYVGMVDNNQSLTLGNWGFSVATAPNLQGLAINGDHAIITLAANSSGVVRGNFNNVYFKNGSNITLEGLGSKATGYDDKNQVIIQIVNNTDNTKDITTYDPNNNHRYSTYTNHYDAQGQNVSRLINYDDGSRDYVVNDSYNTHEWAAYSETFNANGLKTLRYTAADDGSGKAERWTNGWTDPNLPNHIDYLNASGQTIRSQDIAYVYKGPGTPLKIGRTETKDIGNQGDWNTVVVNYDYNGRPISGGTKFDNGFFANGISNQYYTTSWNFASSVDSNSTLFSVNPFFDFSPTKMLSLDLPSLSSYDPFAYYGNNYAGYRGWDFQGAASTNPYTNYMLINSNYKWYQDFDQSYGNFAPVAIDLNKNGVEITLSHSSSVFLDADGFGSARQSAWVKPSDGLLVIDLAANGQFGPDGIISQMKEFSFSEKTGTSGNPPKSDMTALREIYDSNHNGRLDTGDDHFKDFFVWQDVNSDGHSQAGELISLKDLNIVSIGLTPRGTSVSLVDESVINGVSAVEYADGSHGLAADLAFAYGDIKSAHSITSNANYATISSNSDISSFYIKYNSEFGELGSSESKGVPDPAAGFGDGAMQVENLQLNNDYIDYHAYQHQLLSL